MILQTVSYVYVDVGTWRDFLYIMLTFFCHVGRMEVEEKNITLERETDK